MEGIVKSASMKTTDLYCVSRHTLNLKYSAQPMGFVEWIGLREGSNAHDYQARDAKAAFHIKEHTAAIVPLLEVFRQIGRQVLLLERKVHLDDPQVRRVQMLLRNGESGGEEENDVGLGLDPRLEALGCGFERLPFLLGREFIVAARKISRSIKFMHT